MSIHTQLFREILSLFFLAIWDECKTDKQIMQKRNSSISDRKGSSKKDMAIILVITFPIYIYFWIFESDSVYLKVYFNI